MDQLQHNYPWTKSPLVVGAPMRQIALTTLASAVTQAGGLGFIAAGNDVSTLPSMLEEAREMQSKDPVLSKLEGILPFGIGVFVWAGRKLLDDTLPLLREYRPAAVWLYAANHTNELVQWTKETRRVTQGATKVWIQIGSVQEALGCVRACQPDVLVVQGQDAGGHGLMRGAGLITLLPEVSDAIDALCESNRIPKPPLVAAGGVLDGRAAAAALLLGADGVAVGTRYLASHESNIAQGYKEAVVKAQDGGRTTGRTKLYDQLRGTTDWPDRYGGRGVLNESFFDHEKGMPLEDNKSLYKRAEKSVDDGWGQYARMTTYAGTGVGLANEILGAAQITEEMREEARHILSQARHKL